MTVNAANRDRMREIRGTLAGHRRERTVAKQALDALKQTAPDDTRQHAIVEARIETANYEIEKNQELEAILLRSITAVGAAGTYSGMSAFDNPEMVEALQRFGENTNLPIGYGFDLGPLCSPEEFAEKISSGDWGNKRMASTGSPATGYPDIADSARLGPYYGIVPQPRRALRILDVIPTSTMDGSAFDYTQEGGSLDSAVPTAEGTLKPAGDLELTDAQVKAVTIPVWLKFKRQQLADVPQLAQTANDRLIYAVNRGIENQIISGNGVGQNMLGILAQPNVQTEAFSANEVLADGVSLGIRDILLADLEPNAVVVNPTDMQRIWTAKSAGSGEYFGGGPFAANSSSLWGLPAIPSKVVPAGTALVGDWVNGRHRTFGCPTATRTTSCGTS
jgi:HK97 family phage major capsid protein